MMKHSGVRTIPNIRVVVVAIVAGQAQRLQIQILQLLQLLLSPPRGMQLGSLMRRSGRWGVADLWKALFQAFGLGGAGEFTHFEQSVPRFSPLFAMFAIAGPCVPSGNFKI